MIWEYIDELFRSSQMPHNFDLHCTIKSIEWCFWKYNAKFWSNETFDDNLNIPKLHRIKIYNWPLLIGCFENCLCSLEYFHFFNFGYAESSLKTCMYQSNQYHDNRTSILAYEMRISLICQFMHFYLFNYHLLQIQENEWIVKCFVLQI